MILTTKTEIEFEQVRVAAAKTNAIVTLDSVIFERSEAVPMAFAKARHAIRRITVQRGTRGSVVRVHIRSWFSLATLGGLALIFTAAATDAMRSDSRVPLLVLAPGLCLLCVAVRFSILDDARRYLEKLVSGCSAR